MADFTQFLSKIQELDHNTTIAIKCDHEISQFEDLDSFSSSDSLLRTYNSNNSTGPFSNVLSTFQSTSEAFDLSTYIQSLSPPSFDTTTIEHPNQVHKETKQMGVPSSVFSNMALIQPLHPLNYSFSNEIECDSTNFIQQIDSLPQNSKIKLSPGVFPSFNISKDNLLVQGSSSVSFECPDQIQYDFIPFILSGGSVEFDKIFFSKGSLLISGGYHQFKSCVFCIPVTVTSSAKVIFESCSFTKSLILSESSSTSLSDCEFSSSFIKINNRAQLHCLKTTFLNTPKPAITAFGGFSYFESCNFSKSNSSNIAAKECELTIVNCSITNQTKFPLIEATKLAIIKILSTSFLGESTTAVFASQSASVYCEKSSIKMSIFAISGALVKLCESRIEIGSILGKSSHIQLINSVLKTSPHSGIIASDLSEVLIENSKISKCGSNALEIHDQSSLIVVGSQFKNNHGGLLLSSPFCNFFRCTIIKNDIGCQISDEKTSPTFSNCTFSGNAICGVLILKGSSPIFKNCDFKENEKCAVSIVASAPTFLSSLFLNNHMIGIDATDESRSQYSSCLFDGNHGPGIQFRKSAKGTFDKCNFVNHEQSPAILISSNSKIIMNDCLLSHSGSCNIEVCDEGEAKITNCTISESLYGVGAYAHDNGTLDIAESTFKDEKKTGIYFGVKGIGSILNSTITNCRDSGIITEGQSHVQIKESQITSNGSCGIRCEGGSVNVEKCNINSHPEFGIYGTSTADVTEKNNDFTKNEKGNTQIFKTMC